MELNKIIQGDCLKEMQKMEENSVDTIITDPPYGLSFMGKKWDYDVPSVELWKEALRVLKPGGTALIFAGSRTQHRMAVNVEDAGFILKDTIMWLYGSGFPKATDISKQLDKMVGAKRKVVGTRKAHDIRNNNLMEASQGKGRGTMDYDYTEPATEEAILWNGWKSHGLKPAYEPILVAMKPNDGTYANNALKHGVSGLNIDGGRIGHNEPVKTTKRKQRSAGWNMENTGFDSTKNDTASANPQGRFPANIILDEEAGKMLDEQSGVITPSFRKGDRDSRRASFDFGSQDKTGQGYSDKGGASRFFYCAKASKSERNAGCEDMEDKNPAYESHRANYKNTKGIETPYAGTGRSGKNFKNNHPTVKPLALMEYLCTLTKTPTGGIVLDMFAGSGTTGVACKNTGRNFILIEKEKEYIDIIEARLKAVPDRLL